MASQLQPTRRRALVRAASAALLGALALAGPAAARTPVDPGTLNPPPPDFFNAQCYLGAGGTVCTLHFSDDPIADEPSGIVCGATELVFSQERSVVGKRYYDANGNLVQRHFGEWMSGTYSNPVTGKSLPWVERDTILHNLSVPGDLATGTIKTTGLITRVWQPGRGTVVLDAGTIVEDVATGALLRSSGPHPFRDYFVDGDTSALQPLCDALD
jgi:hypothetical protein